MSRETSTFMSVWKLGFPIRYTITGDLLKYNTTSLPLTSCTLPATNCSISLSNYPIGEDVCIIATLESRDDTFYLYYTTELSQHWKMQEVAFWVVMALCCTVSIVCVIILALICRHYQHRALKKETHIMLKEMSAPKEVQ